MAYAHTVKFTLLDCTLTLQMLQIVAFGVVLFTLVWLAPETLFKLIQYWVSQKITLPQLGQLVLYHLPSALQQSIPMAALVGSVFMFRSWSLNSELTALMSAGISFRRLLLPLTLVGALVAAGYTANQELALPWAGQRLNHAYEACGLKPEADTHFAFVEKNPQTQQLQKFFLIGNTTTSADDAPSGPRQVGNKLRDFIVLFYQDGANDGSVQISRILKAASGHWDATSQSWQLDRGMEYLLDAEGVYRSVTAFANTMVQTGPYPAQLLQFSVQNPLEMSYGDLKQYLNLSKLAGQLQDQAFYQVRLHQKWVFPLVSGCFVLLGAWMGIERVRSDRMSGLVAAALVVFLYSVCIPVSFNLGSLGWVQPWLAAWLPFFVALIGAVTIQQVRQLIR
jgi:lipopolysaccharide export system permease protein